MGVEPVRVKVTLTFLAESDNPQEEVFYWLNSAPANFRIIGVKFEEVEAEK